MIFYANIDEFMCMNTIVPVLSTTKYSTKNLTFITPLTKNNGKFLLTLGGHLAVYTEVEK